jgi:probable rRNA maturation factor
MNIFINDEQEVISIPEDIDGVIESAVKAVLEQEKGRTDYEVSISFVDDERIKELNRIYRGKDSSTDVLSFPLYEDEEIENLEKSLHMDIEELLGDVVISAQTAKRQAKSYGHSFKREIAYLVVHSMLHLLGYDHMEDDEKREMRSREKEVIKKIKIFKDGLE